MNINEKIERLPLNLQKNLITQIEDVVDSCLADLSDRKELEEKEKEFIETHKNNYHDFRKKYKPMITFARDTRHTIEYNGAKHKTKRGVVVAWQAEDNQVYIGVSQVNKQDELRPGFIYNEDLPLSKPIAFGSAGRFYSFSLAVKNAVPIEEFDSSRFITLRPVIDQIIRGVNKRYKLSPK